MSDHDEDEIMSDRERSFKRYKDSVGRSGKPFMPYGMFHDTVASLLVVILTILLSVVWYTDAACGTPFEFCGDDIHSVKEQEESKPLLGPLYEDKADPATTHYDPRPEWYFYFLFQLLRIFSWPESVILGTIGVPTIFLVLLIAWPFLDRRRERRPSRRPLAMVTAAATAVVLLTFTYQGMNVGHSGDSNEGAIAPEVMALPGAKLVVAAEGSPPTACQSCHIIGSGSATTGPDLTNQADRGRGVDWQIEHLKDPPSKVPGSTMPPYGGAELTEEQVVQVAQFLESLGNPEKAKEFQAGTAGADAKKGTVEQEPNTEGPASTTSTTPVDSGEPNTAVEPEDAGDHGDTPK